MKLCDLTKHTFFYSEECGDGRRPRTVEGVAFFRPTGPTRVPARARLTLRPTLILAFRRAKTRSTSAERLAFVTWGGICTVI